MLTKMHCPGCGSAALSSVSVWRRQPVVLNYRFATASEAKAVPRRDMPLRQCGQCGLIFNCGFEECIVPYDDRYENSQSHSPAFQEHMLRLAQDLTARYSLQGASIMEVGCGKGEFLSMLCAHADARGVGFDSSCERSGIFQNGRIQFHKRYATGEDAAGGVDALICRHVVEHVSEIGVFLRLLSEMARNGRSRLIYIETPSWEWIDKHDAFWDIFYEHCNYFSLPTLAHLATRAGMTVMRHVTTFGGQYQSLELKPGPSGESVTSPEVSILALEDFAGRTAAACERLKARLIEAGAAQGWAVWGAGAKGVSFANWLRPIVPKFVVDANPAKQGMYIPGTSIPIVAPGDSRLREMAVILIANPNYASEIRYTLFHTHHYRGSVLVA